MFRVVSAAVMIVLLAGCSSTPTPDPSTPAAVPVDDDCLVGTWKSAPGEAGAFLEQLAEGQFGDTLGTVDADGSMIVTFAGDSTFLYQPDVTFTLAWPAGGTQTGSVTGEASGTWSTKDGTVFANADASDVQLALNVGGETLTGDTFGWTSLPITTSRYECGEDSLVLTFNITASSYPMELVPAT